MKHGRYIILTVLILLIQLVLTSYGQIPPYIYICLLPAVILHTPTSWPGWAAMLEAFALGLLTDVLADGPLGLNTAALLPVALMQKPFLRLFLDAQTVERGYGIGFRQNGYLAICGALACEVLLFFIIYVILDSAGVRSFGFNICKILFSSLCSLIAGIVACGVLSEGRKN